MKVVLRSAESGLFFLAPERWTPSMTMALNFEHSAMAAKAARRLRLKQVEVIFVSDLGVVDMIVPLEAVRDPEAPPR